MFIIFAFMINFLAQSQELSWLSSQNTGALLKVHLNRGGFQTWPRLKVVRKILAAPSVVQNMLISAKMLAPQLYHQLILVWFNNLRKKKYFISKKISLSQCHFSFLQETESHKVWSKQEQTRPCRKNLLPWKSTNILLRQFKGSMRAVEHERAQAPA